MPNTGAGALPSEPELLRAIADQIPTMLAFWDASQRCRFANRAYETWFGVSPESLIGKHISELLGPLYALNLPYIEGALRGEPQEFERTIPSPTGGPARHSLANYIPHVVDGVVRGFFVSVSDVSAVKRAEQALKESEERLRLVIDGAPIGMATVAVDGRFVRVNTALCEIVGYQASELTGRTFQEITHPDDLDADLELAGKLSRGEIQSYQLEKRYIRKDGTTVTIMLHGSALRGADGAPVLFIAQIEDITERKSLETALRLAEAKSSGILATSADAIISLDENFRISLFNEGAEKIFGYSKNEVVGSTLDMLIPDGFRAIHRRHVETFAAGSVVSRRMGDRNAKILGLRKNGEEFPADAAISKLEVGGKKVLTVSLRDVTDQKRVEREQRFLAEAGPILTGSLDYEETLTVVAELAAREIADLCIVEIVDPDQSVRRVKVASSDVAKKTVCDVLAGIRIDRSLPHLTRSVLTGEGPILMTLPSLETIASFSQGREHLDALLAADIKSFLAVPLRAQGRLLGALAFISSSTSRLYGLADVHMAEELASRAALAIQNARLYLTAQQATEARDNVLSIVAHDLRNHLNSIQLQALARRQGPGTERGNQLSAERIQRAVARMNRLIQDLLDVAKAEAGQQLAIEHRRVAASLTVTKAIELLSPLAESAEVELKSEIDEGVPDVWADSNRLLQILENLAGNALKFTPGGGHVTIGARAQDGSVLFYVADTGSGITSDQLPHVFDRFWQSRREDRRGAGLGLAIVKVLVEAHGGRIWIESAPGHGSTFYFNIPTASAANDFPGGELGAGHS